jgi:hypothetical protein
MVREMFSGAAGVDHRQAMDEVDRVCEFRRNPATDSDLKPATVPI